MSSSSFPDTLNELSMCTGLIKGREAMLAEGGRPSRPPIGNSIRKRRKWHKIQAENGWCCCQSGGMCHSLTQASLSF